MGQIAMHPPVGLKSRPLLQMPCDRAAWRQYSASACSVDQRTFSNRRGGTGRARYQAIANKPPSGGGPEHRINATRARESLSASPCQRSRPEYRPPMTQPARSAPRSMRPNAVLTKNHRRPCGRGADARARRGWTALPDPVRQPPTCQRGFLAHGGQLRGSDAGTTTQRPGHLPRITAKPRLVPPRSGSFNQKMPNWLPRSKKGKDHLAVGHACVVKHQVPAPQTRVSRPLEPQRIAKLGAPSCSEPHRRILRASSTARTDSASDAKARVPAWDCDHTTPARSLAVSPLICIRADPMAELFFGARKWVGFAVAVVQLFRFCYVLFFDKDVCGAAGGSWQGLRSRAIMGGSLRNSPFRSGID